MNFRARQFLSLLLLFIIFNKSALSHTCPPPPPPDSPVIDSVSVDPVTGKTMIGWQQCTSPNVVKYIIYQNIGGPWFVVDSVFGVANTFYLNMLSDPSSGPEKYAVAAVNAAKEISPMSAPHTTIFLKSPVADVCNDKITITWTPYKYLNPDIKGYRIYMKKDIDPFILLGAVDTTDSTFVQNGLSIESVYCYYIQAFTDNPVKVSTSNIQCIVPHKPRQPEFVFVRNATVIDNKKIEVSFFTDTTVHVSYYKIMRSDDGTDYHSIVTIPGNNIYATVKYTDENVEVDRFSYYYMIQVYDSCGERSITSNIGKSLLLKGNAHNDQMFNHLDWTEYLDRNIREVFVERAVEGADDFSLLKALVPDFISWTDDVSELYTGNGRFKYYVKAVLYDFYKGEFNLHDTVVSNTIILNQAMRVFMPTAFSPSTADANSVFKPFGSFIDILDFKLIVYDSWGKVMFESSDPENGWNGTYNSTLCQMGVYAYYLRLKDSENIIYVKKGTVLLLN
jgi:gliding motility-associated-like protein